MTRRDAHIRDLKRRIRELEDADHALLTGGVSSASLGSAGNSQSYTRISHADYQAKIKELKRELRAALGRTYRRTSPDFITGGNR